ncbi:MAG: U32 family peptidase [Dehalococcoidales bacterium]|nr:U32 family peptidase [Dehalococcoidales bacterium]
MTSRGESVRYSLRPELLSPAGDWESLQAAVINGADAVYLGTRDFNARMNAKNFSLEELDRTVNYCHNQGVRVYLTLNILVKNSELPGFFEVLSRAYAAGIDGVILQHTSFIEIVKKNYPDLAVFISTQGAIGNTLSAGLMKEADRIILPREMPLTEIKKMVNAGFKVEIFVHGALCFSYSGLCLFSSFVSGRSGNRGNCAQLCRQKYNNTYPLSTRELCLVRLIPEFIRAGINAFKIEGRMRSALYTAVATRMYRKAIDSFLAGEFQFPRKEMDEMEVVFNREFTEGFAGGENDLISAERPMNRGAYLGVMDNGGILLQRPVRTGDGLGIWSRDNVTGAVVEKIIRDGKTVESGAAGDKVNLGIGAKDGHKIYLTSSPRIRIEPDFTLKREPLNNPHRRPSRAILPRIVKQKAPFLQRFMARAYSLAEAREIVKSEADIVFYDIFQPDFPGPGEWHERTVMGAYLPRIMNDAELSLAVALLGRKKPGAIMTGNIGFLARRDAFNVPVYLDYSLNIFNDIDALFCRNHKVVPVLSPELSLVELTAFKDREVVIFCHGDIPLVNTCIEIKDEKLVDDKGYAFPVRREHGYWQILNSRPFGMFSDIRKLRTIGFNQFYIDQKKESANFVLLYRNMLKQGVPDRRMRKGYTAGHIYKGVA